MSDNGAEFQKEHSSEGKPDLLNFLGDALLKTLLELRDPTHERLLLVSLNCATEKKQHKLVQFFTRHI